MHAARGSRFLMAIRLDAQAGAWRGRQARGARHRRFMRGIAWAGGVPSAAPVDPAGGFDPNP